MKYLSMGMTDSYKVALEEGANIIRIGSKYSGKGLPVILHAFFLRPLK